MTVGGPTTQPVGHFDFCKTHAAECSIRSPNSKPEHLTNALLRRILFLGGDPDMRPHGFAPGKTVVEMLEKDLQTEYQVRANLAAAVKLCESQGDYVSRDILIAQLRDTEEDHAWWLEQQLGLIRRIGLELYQTSKIDAKGSPAH